MIARLHDRHRGATAAIIGSGPTSELFDPEATDLAIGVNGAAHLADRGVRLDYFVCGSSRAPRRSWWQVDCARTRVICVRIAALDRILYPEAEYPELERATYPFDDIDTIELPTPVAPHLTYRYTREPASGFLRGARPFNKLVIGGTTSAKAAQLAYLMGCERLRLYGCAFSPETSGSPEHYFYGARGEAGGVIDERQIAGMDETLAVVRGAGVRVEVVGATRLSEVDQLLPAAV